MSAGSDGPINIRGATASDAVRIFELIEEAKEFFRINDINMWQWGYPHFYDIADDVASGNSYVFEQDGKVEGYVFITFGEEEFHSTLKGEWMDGHPAVFHRLVVDAKTKRSGIGTSLIAFVEDVAKSEGCTSIRTETDETNVPMRGLLSKMGYSERGALVFDGRDKLGFEKLL